MIIHIVSVVILLILLQWQQKNIMMSKELKKYFMYCISLTIIVILAETGCSVFDNTVPENRGWSVLCNVIGFGGSPFVFLIESRCYEGNHRKKIHRKRKRWIWIPATVNLFVTLASPVTGWIFYVSEDCVYTRGPLFYLYTTVFTFSVLVTMYRKIEAIRNYPHYFRTRIISSTALMILGLLVQVASPKYYVSWVVISFYLVLFYALSCETGSMIDGLTGLLNRSAFNKMIQNLDMSKKCEYAVVMLDVNEFKQINDTKGHIYGDFCLKETASILLGVFKNNSYVFRFGGDEFIVLLKKEGFEIEECIRKINEETAKRREGHQVFPDIAVGYAEFEAGKEPGETIDLADTEMYKDKQRMKSDRKNQIKKSS